MSKIDKHAFWKWAYSDLLSNTSRSVLGEFIVHEALNLSDDTRIEWDNVDLRWNGLKIEVKTSAYIQSWKQEKLSKIVFDIAPRKQSWDSSTNLIRESKGREADIYIFCILTCKDKMKATELDILDVKNWDFFIVKTSILDTLFPYQKSITLSVLEKHFQKTSFVSIKNFL